MSNGSVVSLLPHARLGAVLEEKDVSVETIRTALAAALIEGEIDDDGDLYLTDGLDFPLWVLIDRSSKLICLHTFLSTSDAKVDDINQLNRRFKVAQFAIVEGKVIANYQLTFRYGVDGRHLITMARTFGSICRAAHSELETRKGAC